MLIIFLTPDPNILKVQLITLFIHLTFILLAIIALHRLKKLSLFTLALVILYFGTGLLDLLFTIEGTYYNPRNEGDIFKRQLLLRFGVWGIITEQVVLDLLNSLFLASLILISNKTKSKIKRSVLLHFCLFDVYTSIIWSTYGASSWWNKFHFISDLYSSFYPILLPISFKILKPIIKPGSLSYSSVFLAYNIYIHLFGISLGFIIALIQFLISIKRASGGKS